jgi:hypothetical protein
MAVVDVVRLGPIWHRLFVDSHIAHGIVEYAVGVVVITDRAVKIMIYQHALCGPFALWCYRCQGHLFTSGNGKLAGSAGCSVNLN